MVRAPNWTEDEFRILLNSPKLSDVELNQGPLRSRSPGAIGFVRAGIYAYHPEKRNSGGILSKMMVHLLEDKDRLRTQCWKCGEWF